MFHHQHRIISAVVLTLALAIAAPAAAKFGRALPTHHTRAHASSTVSAAPASGSSFHWKDAGIGAGGALLLTALLIGGVVTVRRSGRGSVQPTT